MTGLSGARWGRLPADQFRRALTLLVLVALPTALVVGIVAAAQSLAAYRANFEARLQEAARTTALAVDSRLASYRAAATVLSLAPELQPGGDPTALYPQARAVGEALGGWVVISTGDPTRPQIVNTAVPPGGRLPERPPPEVLNAPDRRALVVSGQPVVTDMFIAPLTGGRAIAVAVPVLHAGSLRFVINFVFEPASLSRLLVEQGLPPGALAAVTDGRLQVVARSADPEHYIGRIAPARMPASEFSDHGMVASVALDGRTSLFALQKLRFAGSWRVAVWMPLDSVAAAATRPVQRLLIAGAGIAALLLMAIGLVWLGRRDERAAYAQLDRVLADLPAVIWVSRVWPDGRLVRQYLSRSAAAVTSWPWRTLRQPGAFVALTDPAMMQERTTLFLDALRNGRSTGTYRMRHADGSWRWMRGSVMCMERAADGSGLLVGCSTDITEEHTVRERLQQAEKLAVLGEIATGIAHEMNQPLAAIAMAAENGARALAHAPPGISAATAKFRRIGEQAHRIATIVDHINLFGRTRTSEAKPLDIAPVLREALQRLAPRLEADGIAVEVELPATLPPVMGISVVLEQALLNILGNACDAYRERPERAVRPIRITASGDGDTLRLSIADQAGGIPEDVLGRVFDPFFTTKDVGKGTGLGLSISLATVTEMGGSITVHNDGGGARFDIVLPVALRPDVATESVHPVSRGQHAGAPAGESHLEFP